MSARLQINHKNGVSEYFLLSLKDLSWTACLIFWAHDSEAFNFAASFQVKLFNFFFFRMTNCDVGCVLFIVLVLNKCKPNLREILWQDLTPSYSSFLLGKYHCYTQISLSALLLLLACFYFACVPFASLSKYQRIPYIVFC